MKIELHDHQLEAVQKMHNGCVLWGGVGTGKTLTALAYGLMREAGKKFVIVTTAKKRDSGDWEREASLLAVPFDLVEVTSWNKINDYIDREGEFFIFDEQRLVGSGAWVKSFYKVAKKNNWVLLSATPGDTWSDYAPMFIANGWYKNITAFRAEHAVYSRYTAFPKIERYIGEGKLVRLRKALLVEMPMDRHTTRHMHDVEVSYDREKLDTVRKKRWNVYEDVPLKNASELFSVMRKVVSTDPSRAEALKKLIAEHPKLIVFYNYNYELEMMRELLGEISQQLTQSSTDQSGQPSTSPSIGSLSKTSFETMSSGLHVPSTKKSDLSSTSLFYTEKGVANPKEFSLSSKPEKQSDMPPWDLNESTGWTKSADGKMSTRTNSSAPLTQSRKRLLESNSGSLLTKEKQTGSLIDLPIPNSKDSVSLAMGPLLKDAAGGGSFGWAEWNGHKHQPIPETDRWVYLVQYASGSEGWNCIDTDAMAFWSLTYSWKQFNQAQGRIDRLNTPFTDLHYYIMMTDSMAEKPVRMSLNKKQDFQPK